MVLEKSKVSSVLSVRNSQRISRENSKQYEEDAQFLARVSSNLNTHFHSCSCSFSSILND